MGGVNQHDADAAEAGPSAPGAVLEDPWADLTNADGRISMLHTGYNGASGTGLSLDDMLLTAQNK